jgi:hypothetical protein
VLVGCFTSPKPGSTPREKTIASQNKCNEFIWVQKILIEFEGH